MTIELSRGEPNSVFATFARLAAEICDTSVASVVLTDGQQWLEAGDGGVAELALPRETPLWEDTLATDGVLEIADLRGDVRLASRPGVATEPGVRYYAGTPLVDATGNVVGTLCALDARPRSLSAGRRDALRFVGSSLLASIDLRDERSSGDLALIDLLGNALDLVADPIAICRVGYPKEKPTFAYVNRAFVDLFGYGIDEILGKTPAILEGPETDMCVIREITRTLRAGSIVFGEVTYYTATGERRVVQIRDRNLSATHRIVSFRDYTRERQAETALAETHLRLQSLLKSNSDAVFTLDRSGRCVDANPAATELVGYACDDLLGSGMASAIPDGIFPDGDPFPEPLANGEPLAFAARYRHRDGRRIDVDCKAIPMVVRGRTEGAYVLATDVTERHRLAELAERQARRAQDLCSIAAETEATDADRIDAALALVMISFGMQNGYAAEICGPMMRITHRIGERLFDVGGEVELSRSRVHEMLALGDVLAIDDLRTHPVVNDGIRFDGTFRGYICAPLHVAGTLFGVIGFLGREPCAFDEADRDFIRLAATLVAAALERRLQNVQLDRMAYVDSLTELPNRAHFTRELARILTTGARFALHFIDLDGFKPLNDRAGHAVGDLALREVGARLAALCGPQAFAARLGGDEFVVIQTGDPGRTEATAFGNAVVASLGAPYLLEGERFALGASVGIAFSPDDGVAADALMRSADAALYRAKTAGRNRVELARVSVP